MTKNGRQRLENATLRGEKSENDRNRCVSKPRISFRIFFTSTLSERILTQETFLENNKKELERELETYLREVYRMMKIPRLNQNGMLMAKFLRSYSHELEEALRKVKRRLKTKDYIHECYHQAKMAEIRELENQMMEMVLREEENRMLEALRLILFQAVRLMIMLCVNIVSDCGKKLSSRNRYEKVVILILWRCGDIERNPGPPNAVIHISDVSRDFCKKMISLLVIKYWESKGEELGQAAYKRKPADWPENIWFGDPSKCKKEPMNTMLKCLHETCLAEKVDVPSQWLTLIEKHKTLHSNEFNKSQKKQDADDLSTWLCELRSLETVDQLFDRLAASKDQERTRIIEHMFQKLKKYEPDLTSKNIQSRMIENESITSQSRETEETAANTDIADKGTSACTDPGDFDCYVDLFDDSLPSLTTDWINYLQSPFADKSTMAYEWESDVANCSKGSKRKLDLYINGDQAQFVQSKRQNTSLEFNALYQISGVYDTDVIDSKTQIMADVMQIVAREMKTSLGDNCGPHSMDCVHDSIGNDTELSVLIDCAQDSAGDVTEPSVLIDCAQDNAGNDTEPSVLIGCAQDSTDNDTSTELFEQLSEYLSDEFIKELSEENSQQI